MIHRQTQRPRSRCLEQSPQCQAHRPAERRGLRAAWWPPPQPGLAPRSRPEWRSTAAAWPAAQHAAQASRLVNAGTQCRLGSVGGDQCAGSLECAHSEQRGNPALPGPPHRAPPTLRGKGPSKICTAPGGPRPRIHPTQPQGTCLLPPFAKPCAAPDHPDAPTLQGWEAEATRAAPALNPVCPAAWMRRPAAESRTRSARPPSSAAPARKASKRTLQGVERGAGCLCQSHSGAARQ